MSSVYEALQRARQGSHGPIHRDDRTRVAPLRAAAIREPLREAPRPAVTLAPGPLAGELGSLLAAIRPLLDGNRGTVLQVVAATRGEGSSTIAREFALLAATGGQRRTLLVDADRHNPATARSFECDTSHGLVELPWNSSDAESVAKTIAGTFLSVSCLIGQRGPGRTDAATIADLYGRLRDQFELIVVDCPAVASGDYLELAPEAADGVILVVQAETTRPAVVAYAKGQIEQAGGTVLGAVLNRRGDYIPNFLYRML